MPRPDRRELRLTGGALAVASGILGMTLLAAALFDEPFITLSRDTTAVLHGNWYVGALSNLGIVVWAVAATCIAVGVATLPAASRPPRSALALTVWLLVDDLYLLHEVVLPQHGIGEHWTMAGEGVLAVIAVLASTRRHQKGLTVLALALTGFAVSIAIDAVTESGMPAAWEDAAKLVGIVAWAAYWGGWVLTDLRAALRGPQADGGSDLAQLAGGVDPEAEQHGEHEKALHARRLLAELEVDLGGGPVQATEHRPVAER